MCAEPVVGNVFVGPRDYVLAKARGEDVELEDYLTSAEPWSVFADGLPLSEWPELWVDMVHDFVWVDDVSDVSGS